MRMLIGIAVLLCFTWFLAPFASANLIDNGSFENPLIAGTYAFVAAGAMTGWSFSGEYQELEIQRNGLYGGWSNPHGSQWAELDGDLRNSSIFQTVSVTAGTPYHLEFYVSPRPARNDGLLLWSVLGSGVSLSGTVTAPYGSYLSHPVWSLVSLDFTPISDGALQVLFTEGGPADGYGMLLDGVSLNAIPLPATAWLLGTGLLGLALVRRRR